MRPNSIIPHKVDMEALLADLDHKPALHAAIREPECIGCTKCLQVCPVDAIMGAVKQMHSILYSECIGCGLCVDPCPVDCIDMRPLEGEQAADCSQSHALAKRRYDDKCRRIEREKAEKAASRMRLKNIAQRKAAVMAAVKRYQEKQNKTHVSEK